MYTKVKSFIILPVLVSIMFAGCFIWNSIGSGFDNFTALFNTYYNAKQAFESAMTDVGNATKEYSITSISGQTVAASSLNSTTRQNFDLAVAKASKVLQFYPNSGYTEDCLFIIGISYYYEGDYIRSGRKFIEEQSTFPESKRFAEALAYYGDIEVRNRNYDDGYRDLKKALIIAEKQDNSEVVAQAAADLSDFCLGQGDTLEAAVYLDTASTFSKGDYAAINSCKAGILYEDLGKYREAAQAYYSAIDKAREIRLLFYARYFIARIDRRSGRFYAALSVLSDLRSDDKYFQYFPLIDYQKAEASYDSGSISSAFADFQRIDTAYSSSEAATRSAFRLANIYLYKIGDYQNSLKYYQRCATHMTVPIISQRAREMSNTLQEYFIDAFRLRLADSLYSKVMLAAAKSDSTVKHSQADIDTLYEHFAEAQEKVGGFFFFKLQILDSALTHYLTIISDFPKSKVYPSALYTIGEYYYSSGDTSKGRGYLNQLISEHPESEYTQSAYMLLGSSRPAYIDSTQIEYDRALDFANGDRCDSSLVILKNLLVPSKSKLKAQILYAIGWVYENKLQILDSAFVYYNRLEKEFPSSDYSANINSAVSTYEQAKRDSAEARKRIADSIANSMKPVNRDTLKTATPLPLKQTVTSATDSSKTSNKLSTQSAGGDSTGLNRRITVPQDSLPKRIK